MYPMDHSVSERGFKRRAFLLGALASLGFLATGQRTLYAMPHQRSLAELHFEDFYKVQGELFSLSSMDGRRALLQLAAVKERTFPATQVAGLRQECFSLTFCGLKDEAFTQDSYQFTHPKLGTFDLLIVPTQPVDYEERYIAIVNRIYPQ